MFDEKSTLAKKNYKAILGIPWIFRKLRRYVLGGFDFSPIYKALEIRQDDVVMDIGCGTGESIEHLSDFAEYHGFDIDERAINFFQRRKKSKMYLYNRTFEKEDMTRIKPDKVIMIGLLHHINEEEGKRLFDFLSRGGVERIVTLDTVYIPGWWTNNLLAFLDRGGYVRTTSEYRDLVRGMGFEIEREIWINTGLHLSCYYGMCLRPCVFIQDR